MPRAKQPSAQEQPQPVEEASEPALTEQWQRIGPAIRQLRQQQELSLSDLAAKTGISVSYLSRLDKGRSVPSFTVLNQTGQELGVPLSFFVETEQDARQVDEQLVEELSHTPIPKRVWPELLGMSLEGREALVDYLQQQVPGQPVPKASGQWFATLT
jgi:transcriptional regulator with XRE-family HTH domain